MQPYIKLLNVNGNCRKMRKEKLGVVSALNLGLNELRHLGHHLDHRAQLRGLCAHTRSQMSISSKETHE